MTHPATSTSAPSPDLSSVQAFHGDDQKKAWEQVALGIFVAVPLVALVIAIPVAWGWGLGWTDLALLVVFYLISGFGITVGFHRYFTHGSFKAKRPLRVGLAMAGSLAIEGPVIRWVADHRKHHAFSDREGDPHSPWRYGDSFWALAKGLGYAHVGWLFDVEQTNQAKYAPDLLHDPDIVRVSRAFPWLVTFSLAAPAVLGGLLTWSWQGAVTAFFWAGIVRVGLLHHVTWSINSLCHVYGAKPFVTRDKSGNLTWLAVPSLGESWHNLHHADPTAARHGVLPGQVDPSAVLIRGFEKAGWASDVRWPTAERLAARRAA
jgi:stearoyl-CoA desaturase (Delta-9 desaturase)